MFEKIILRRSDKGPILSAGELAEALLFYQNVHIVLDYASLRGLISYMGMPTLLSLISRPSVSAIYCDETLATRTEKANNLVSHSFVSITVDGDKDVGQLHSIKKRLEHLLSKHGYKKKPAKGLIEGFRRRIPIRKLTDNHFIDGGIVKAAQQDLYEANFIQESVRLALTYLVGTDNIPPNFRFKVHSNGSTFQIDTDLNFQIMNTIGKQYDPNVSDISPAHLINYVLTARTDTILASYYGGEFYTSALTSGIICLKYKELLRRICLEKNELKEFYKIVISEGPSLRDVINSGERTFDEFLTLLDKSQRFREWAKGVNPDEKLVKEYWSEVAAEGWINKLPNKILRYMIGTVVGAVATPLPGLAISVADNFLLEKILGGWRPSHFVERTLKPFINKEEEL